MEIYRIEYKQLCYIGQEMSRLDRLGKDYDKKMDELLITEDGICWPSEPKKQAVVFARYTSEYTGHKTLVALPVPDISLIEETVRRFVASEKDEHHWFYITEIQYLGSALGFKAPESQESND